MMGFGEKPGEANGVQDAAVESRRCIVCLSPVMNGVAIRSRGRVFCPPCYEKLRQGQDDPIGAEAIDVESLAEAAGPGEPTPLWVRTQARLGQSRRQQLLWGLFGALALAALGAGVWYASGLAPVFLLQRLLDLLFGGFAGWLLRRRGGGMVNGGSRFALAYLAAYLIGILAVVPFLPKETSSMPGGPRQVLAGLAGLLLAVVAGAVAGRLIRREVASRTP